MKTSHIIFDLDGTLVNTIPRPSRLGFRGPAELIQAGAEHIIHQPDELLGIL